MFKIEKLPDGSHRDYGEYDNASRWYPDDAIRVPGSFNVRPPSRAWPYNYLNHFYTLKFAKLLAAVDPKKYCEVMGISKRRKLYKEIIATAVTARLTEGG